MIERLEAGIDTTSNRLGGKSTGLLRLIEAGLNVPDAWVIPAPVSLDPAARTQCLSELAEWWNHVERQFPGSVWAVRSSAVAEDLEGASFAGVYETVLGIGTREELVTAIEECWAAHDTERARVYRDANAISGGGGIALLLQRMLKPRVAGVLLTSNPQRAFADEVVIDASYGLGEAIVSGKTGPDHIVLVRSTGAIRSEHLGAKQVETVYEDGGIRERAVDPTRTGVRCVTDEDIAALHRLATTVGTSIGSSRDVEWAIEGDTLYALQDRPITNIPPLNPTVVWTRKMADEYLSEYSLPLPTGLLGPWMAIAQFIETMLLQGRWDLVGVEPMKTHNGYSFMSGEYLARMAQAFPVPVRASTFGDWFTPLWNEHIAKQPWKARYFVGMLRAPFRDRGRGTINANPLALERHCARIDATVVPRLSQDYTQLALREWREQMDELEDLGLAHFRIIRWGMGPYNHGCHKLLQDLLRKEAMDDDGTLYYALISGLPGTKTAALNREVWELGVAARREARLVELIRQGLDYAALRPETSDSPFWDSFDAFVARHGHRSASRDIARPRWCETPNVLLGFVRVQLQTEAPPEDPSVSEQRAETQRVEAMRIAHERLGHGPFGWLRTAILDWACEKTQTFTVYRENQRYHLDYLLSHMRWLVREQGRRLVERGALEEVDDVFFLERSEFYDAIAESATGPAADPAVIAERKQHFHTYRDRRPASFLFDDVETEGEIAEGDAAADEHGDGLSGLGASRGIARGRVRVVPELARLSEVEPGEILVADNIDPGWTSVFPLIAGLITETGGVLSHGAILAREYGVPTVTGVAGVTTLLSTGTVIEIDGHRGTITAVDESPEVVNV